MCMCVCVCVYIYIYIYSENSAFSFLMGRNDRDSFYKPVSVIICAKHAPLTLDYEIYEKNSRV